jgi:hypothetical protein
LFADVETKLVEEFKKRFGLSSYEFEFAMYVSRDGVTGLTNRDNGLKFKRIIEKTQNVNYAEASFEELKILKVFHYHYNPEIVKLTNDLLLDFNLKPTYLVPSKPAPLFVFGNKYCFTIAPITRI